jgi:hypothetical protein
MNKRPVGTRVLTKEEHDRTLNALIAQRDELAAKIRIMSVTLFTVRARNQYKGFQERMEEVDRAIAVFEKEHVIVRD